MRSISLVWVACWSAVFKCTAAQGCIDLQGVVNGGGDGLVDLDVVEFTLEKEPFDLSVPTTLTFAKCTGGLETPISMRTVLGVYLDRSHMKFSPANRLYLAFHCTISNNPK